MGTSFTLPAIVHDKTCEVLTTRQPHEALASRVLIWGQIPETCNTHVTDLSYSDHSSPAVTLTTGHPKASSTQKQSHSQAGHCKGSEVVSQKPARASPFLGACSFMANSLLHTSHPLGLKDSIVVWRFQDSGNGNCKASQSLALEVTQNHFWCIILAKTIHQSSPKPKG